MDNEELKQEPEEAVSPEPEEPTEDPGTGEEPEAPGGDVSAPVPVLTPKKDAFPRGRALFGRAVLTTDAKVIDHTNVQIGRAHV